MKKVLVTSRSFGKVSDEPLNILKEAGELPAWTPYEDLVTTTFAAEASESAH